MVSVKERLAELRARRAKKLHSTKTGPTSNVFRDSIIPEETLTPINHSLSNIARRFEPDSDEEDRDEDEGIQLVILPPASLTPSKKSRGARLTWRQKEQERARVKSKQFLEDMGDYEAMTIPVEPVQLPTVTASQDKEEEDDNDENEDEDVDDDDDDEQDIDDEERALQGAADEDERALELAQQDGENDDSAELMEETGSMQVAPDKKVMEESNKSIETIGVKDGDLREDTLSASAAVHSEQKPDHEQPSPEGEHDACLSEPVIPNEAIDVLQDGTNLNSNIPEVPPAVHENVKSTETPEKEPKANENVTDQGQHKPTVSRPTITDTCEFFEDEAEEDPAEQNVAGSPNDGENDLAPQYLEGTDLGIVHDSTPNAKDGKKLAKFHRQWELQQDLAEINAAVTGSSPMADEDEDEVQAYQPNEVETSRRSVEQEQNSANGVPDSSPKDGEHEDNDDKHMDTMFLKDDSNSKFLEEDENEDDEKITRTSRMRARALWRARQKTKMKLREDDSASLSRFSLFIDTESSRSEAIRTKLESSCRPVPEKRNDKGGLENGQKDDRVLGKRRAPGQSRDEQPTWAKRQACLEKKNEKRRHAVAVGKWSFSCHSDKIKTSNPKAKSSSAPVGPSFTACKDRSKSNSGTVRSRPVVKTKPPRSTRQQQTPTNFKGLLSLLGQQAQTDT